MTTPQAYVTIPPEDADAIESAAAEHLAADRFAVIHDETDGSVLLCVAVNVHSIDDMSLTAAGIYHELRRLAGLTPGSTVVRFGLAPGLLREARHFELLANARELLDDNRCEFAIIASQIAVEIYTELAVTALVERLGLDAFGAAVLDTIDGYGPHRRRVQALWNALTADTIQQRATVWRDYREHVERRNDVVHRGHKASASEARASLEAATQMLLYLAGVSGRVLYGRPAGP
jgi:hypothetical protein